MPDPPGRLGLTLPLQGETVRDVSVTAAEAEALGYSDIWSFETSGVDGFSPLIAAGLATTSVRLGTAIVSTYTRGPAILAMTTTACAQVAPERFCLGLGASTEAIVSGWNGIGYERPVSHVRETVRRMRDALAGRRMPLMAGARGGFRLDAPPPSPVPVYVAALRSGMLRLAGAVADGVIINFLPVDAVPLVLAEVRAGAEEAGRDPDRVDVVGRLMTCTDASAPETALTARFILATYVTSPPYEAFLRWLGLDGLVDPVVTRWRAGDRGGALDAMSDELIGRLLVVGSPDDCRKRIDAYRAAGMKVPVIAPFSGAADEQDRRSAVHRMARELAPRPSAIGG